MTLVLHVDVDVNTSPDQAACEMLKMAAQLQCVVKGTADLWGTIMEARPGDSPGTILANFERDCRLQNYPQD